MIDEAQITSLREEVGEVFADMRLENRWNKRTAASNIGIPLTTLTRIENATSDVYLGTVQKMAHAYGYNIEINFIPLDAEGDIYEGVVNAEDSDDVSSGSAGPIEGSDGGAP